MLNKNKKLKGKPWGGRGRGRGGDQGMDEMMPVSMLIDWNQVRLVCLYVCTF